MKSILFLLSLLFVVLVGNAQTNTFPPSGPVGIGTTTPRAKLDVASTDSNSTTSILGRLSEGNSAGTGTYLGVQAYSTAPINTKSFALEHWFYGNLNNAINFYRGTATTGGFITFATYNGTERMRIDGSGNVGIGTTNPGTYKLAVEGTMGARKIQVKQTSWADFVFDPAYKLPDFTEVEQYIQANKHLPGIPSEAEVLDNGLDLGEMHKNEIQKIEELTLYIIQLKKEIETLSKKVDSFSASKN